MTPFIGDGHNPGRGVLSYLDGLKIPLKMASRYFSRHLVDSDGIDFS